MTPSSVISSLVVLATACHAGPTPAGTPKELDVEAPNESAPGHNPETDEEDDDR